MTQSSDSIELLIIRKDNEQMDRIEHIYVKKSDFHIFFNGILDANPYFKAIKWMIASILAIFTTSLIAGAFLFFSQIAK